MYVCMYIYIPRASQKGLTSIVPVRTVFFFLLHLSSILLSDLFCHVCMFCHVPVCKAAAFVPATSEINAVPGKNQKKEHQEGIGI